MKVTLDFPGWISTCKDTGVNKGMREARVRGGDVLMTARDPREPREAGWVTETCFPDTWGCGSEALFGLLPSGTVRDAVHVVLSHYFRGHRLQQPEETDAPPLSEFGAFASGVCGWPPSSVTSRPRKSQKELLHV